jgi:hypothetical protein
LFVALCVVPTAVIGVVGVARRSDSVREDWRHTLSVYSGLRFTIERVGHPRPGAVLLERVRGYDPETDALVLDCRNLEIDRDSDGLYVRAFQPEIHADRAARLLEALERSLRREWPESDMNVTLAANTLTWHVGGVSQTLEGFLAQLGPSESTQRLLAGFSLPATSNRPPVALQISRNTTANPPLTVVELDAKGVLLPAAMFRPLTESVARLGPRALFVGQLRLEHGADGWRGTVVGNFSEVDLAALTGGVLPGAIAGSAEVLVHRADVVAGRIEHAFVTLESAGGQIARSLVAAGREYLKLGDPAGPLPVSQTTPYDGLSFDLRLDEAGTISVRSRSPDERRPLLWRGSEIYWHEPPESQSTLNLLRAVAPDPNLLVPAERRAASLMQWLPLPKRNDPPPITPGAAPDGALNRVPFDARLRLRGPVETAR